MKLEDMDVKTVTIIEYLINMNIYIADLDIFLL